MDTIVKIQKALFPADAPVLIYDAPKRIFREMEFKLLPDDIRKALTKSPKVYWRVQTDVDGMCFRDQAKAQPW